MKNSHAFIANQFLVASTLSIGIVLFVVFFSLDGIFGIPNIFSAFLDKANTGIQSTLIANFSRNDTPNSHIVIVAIDDASLSDTGGLGRWQDWKRSSYAQVVRELRKEGALAIGLDIIFSEASPEAEDRELEEALKEGDKDTVLAFSLAETPLFPLERFLQYTNLGFANPFRASQIITAIEPADMISGDVYESFSLALLRRFLDQKFHTVIPPTRKSSPRLYSFHKEPYRYIPYAREDIPAFLIHFIPRYMEFETISFRDVYSGTYDTERIKGKIVLIGATATALGDERITPVGLMPGVYLHANAINTILGRTFTVYIDPIAEGAFLAILTFFLVFSSMVLSRWKQVVFVSLCLLFFFLLEIFLFRFVDILFNFQAELILSIILVMMVTITYKYLYEETGKHILRKALSQYVSEDIVQAVLTNYEEVQLSGVRRKVTLLFSDIEAFTTLSEELAPEELIAFLTEYLEGMSRIIMSKKGFINKYEGDAIMSMWGALVPEPDQAYLACDTALAQQRYIREFNRTAEQKYGFQLHVRIGINTGVATVGNIGSAGKKLEFTAIGDTVNTASRFEGINKLYHTDIIVGATTYDDTKKRFLYRLLDHVKVKGKNVATPIYELLGYVASSDDRTMGKIHDHEEALGYYQRGDWKQARISFMRNLKAGDVIAETFLARMKSYRGVVPKGWDGVWIATEK